MSGSGRSGGSLTSISAAMPSSSALTSRSSIERGFSAGLEPSRRRRRPVRRSRRRHAPARRLSASRTAPASQRRSRARPPRGRSAPDRRAQGGERVDLGLLGAVKLLPYGSAPLALLDRRVRQVESAHLFGAERRMHHGEFQRREQEVLQRLQLAADDGRHVPISRRVEVREGEHHQRPAIRRPRRARSGAGRCR